MPFNDDADPEDDMPPADAPEDVVVACSGSISLPPIGATNGE